MVPASSRRLAASPPHAPGPGYLDFTERAAHGEADIDRQTPDMPDMIAAQVPKG